MGTRLGQHFLNNAPAIKKIVAALELKENDSIIEIGPGDGALTIPLVQECGKLKCKIVTIEKDRILAEKLRSRFATKGDVLEIVDGDALRLIEPGNQKNNRWKLVGNIPYYITGKLLRIISELEKKPELTVLTIQKEVAERVAAKPPKMNLLAAATQIWAEPEIIGYLKPEDFDPPPEVDSAIIKLTTNLSRLNLNNIENYYRLIKAIFKQPRKTVLNNLSTSPEMSKKSAMEILKKLGLTGQERPQNLDLNTLKKLSTLLSVN